MKIVDNQHFATRYSEVSMTKDGMEKIFTNYYLQNRWRGTESRSGPGSTLSATTELRKQLRHWFSVLGVRTIVDAPCGDLNWMSQLEYNFERYVGVDIADDAIRDLRTRGFGSEYHFQRGDITTDILPTADALLCRDCLVHLPYAMIDATLEVWKKSDFRFIFVTTFPAHKNVNCKLGAWRPLNLQQEPFFLPEPLTLIREYPRGKHRVATNAWESGHSIT